MAIIKETLPFTYNENYQKIIQKLIDAGFDGPYEGSNSAILASVLSYIVSSLNFNTAVNINENILSLATKRKNVIQDARILSYEPSYKKSSILEISLEFFRTGYFKIPKYSKFIINGFNYNYLGDDLEFNIEILGEIKKIQVKEGVLIRYEDYPDILTYKIDENFEYIDIPWNDVEDDGVECYVTYYDDFGVASDNITFTKSSFNMTDINDNNTNKFFRKDDIDTGNCRIYFQLGAVGTKLPSNSRIYVNVLRSSGTLAYYEGVSSAKPDGDLSSFCKIITSGSDSPVLISQAQDEETIESIKANAPLFYNSAARTVTVHDYNSIISTHQSVKKIMTWGGEDDYPSLPGYLFFAAEPRRKDVNFGVYKKILKSDGSFNYKKESSVNNICEIIDGEESTNQYFFNIDYKNLDNMYLNDGEIFSNEFNENGTPKTPGIFDLVDSKNLPALRNNIKNPVYINLDLQVNIKQYPFGVPKSEVRKKLYNKIREKIGEMEKFEGEYIHSNLIRYLDNELGIGNGVEVTPFFSMCLSDKNKVMQFTENKDFSKVNCFYSKKYDSVGKYLVIAVYLSMLSRVGDEINIFFNKEKLEFILDGKDYYNYAIKDEDKRQSFKVFYFKDPGFSPESLFVRLQSYDGLSNWFGNDINLYNFKNKKIYFYANIGLELTNIKIILPRFVRVGDTIEVFGLYGERGAESSIYKFVITQEDLNNNFVMCDDINRAEYAGVLKPSDYKVVYTCLKEDIIPPESDTSDENELKSNQILGYACANLEQAKNLTTTQDNAFNNIETANLYYNFYEETDGNIIVRVWIPEGAKPNDNLLIEYAGNITTTSLTDAMISNGIVDINVEGKLLDLTKITYKGENNIIGIYPSYTERKNELLPIEDDRIQFIENLYDNIIEYVPSTTYDRQIQLKESSVITFFNNYNNKFDVRNLIANYDENECTINVYIPNGMPLSYEAPFIILNNHRKPGLMNFNIEVQVKRGDLLFKNQVIYCKEPEVKLEVDEGPGGVYAYLDIPIEGIYDSKGQIIFDNLPFINYLEFKNNVEDNYINFESLMNPNIVHPPLIADELGKISGYTQDMQIYVDTSITEENVSKMLPFYTTLAEFIELDLSKVAYIRFPIYMQSLSGAKELVGSYTIYNNRAPYIRIKFLNSLFIDNSVFEFALVYPSDNIKLLRNSILRLRNITFDDKLDYYDLREKQRNGDFLNDLITN